MGIWGGGRGGLVLLLLLLFYLLAQSPGGRWGELEIKAEGGQREEEQDSAHHK